MSTVQMTFWPQTEDDIKYHDIKECRNDITQLRKSMFARHGEMMKMMSDLQKQIDEMKESRNV